MVTASTSRCSGILPSSRTAAKVPAMMKMQPAAGALYFARYFTRWYEPAA